MKDFISHNGFETVILAGVDIDAMIGTHAQKKHTAGKPLESRSLVPIDVQLLQDVVNFPFLLNFKSEDASLDKVFCAKDQNA